MAFVLAGGGVGFSLERHVRNSEGNSVSLSFKQEFTQRRCKPPNDRRQFVLSPRGSIVKQLGQASKT